MAPVARGIADREKDRLVLPARFREGFFAPRVPVHRIVRVLEKIWRLLTRQPVRVFGTRRRVFSRRCRSMSLTTLAREIQSGSGSSSYSDQILVIPSEVEESCSGDVVCTSSRAIDLNRLGGSGEPRPILSLTPASARFPVTTD